MTYKGLCVFSVFALFTLLGTNQVQNVVRVHFTTRQVPAVALGILDHGFALHEIFLMQKVA